MLCSGVQFFLLGFVSIPVMKEFMHLSDHWWLSHFIVRTHWNSEEKEKCRQQNSAVMFILCYVGSEDAAHNVYLLIRGTSNMTHSIHCNTLIFFSPIENYWFTLSKPTFMTRNQMFSFDAYICDYSLSTVVDLWSQSTMVINNTFYIPNTHTLYIGILKTIFQRNGSR